MISKSQGKIQIYPKRTDGGPLKEPSRGVFGSAEELVDPQSKKGAFLSV